MMQKINIFDAHKNFNNLHKINIYFLQCYFYIIIENLRDLFRRRKEIIFKQHL